MFESIRRLVAHPPLVSPEEAGWQVACFEWLLRGSGGFGRFRHSLLVLPTDEFFPQCGLAAGGLEVALFEQIKKHAGMDGWRCALEIQLADPDPHVAPTLVVQDAPRSPLGSFCGNPAHATITYRPGLLSDPMSFIATMAHELAHFLISDIAEPPPGGKENLEFATDLAAVFLGFGVFLINAAFTFSQFDHSDAVGWSARRQGYLSEPQLLHALVIFAVLLEIEPRRVTHHIKASFRRAYVAAYKTVPVSGSWLDVLRAVRPVNSDKRDITPHSDRLPYS